MEDDDFAWAAALMQRRRERYAAYSPIFWRPAAGIVDAHTQFLRAAAAREGAVALRTDGAFAISYPYEGRCAARRSEIDRRTRRAPLRLCRRR